MTEFGLTLARALMPLCAWGDANRERIDSLLNNKALAASD
jgi:DNA-binding HxlR family transcriptional regulator